MADGWEPGKFRLGNRRWLDGLRGVAILMVLGFHLRLLGGGSLGVDVFFVLSGFLITALLAEEWQRRGTISLSVVRTVGFALLLRLPSKQLIAQPLILATQMFVFLFQDGDPLHGTGMHTLPVPDLLAEFEILPPERRDLATQLRDFPTQLTHQFVQIVRCQPARVNEKTIHGLRTLP